MSIKIALAGNPNCGKTTLFNDLTGSNQYVGNWPGVTVEKKEGKLKQDKSVSVVDLPGIYSLSPYTSEEAISRNYVLEEKPDIIIIIIKAFLSLRFFFSSISFLRCSSFSISLSFAEISARLISSRNFDWPHLQY